MSALKVCLFLALVATVTCANNGAVCNSDIDCTVANAVCVKPYETCDSGFCGCDYTYYQTSVTTCKKAANIGEACETSADCTVTTFDSQCTANVCECTLPEAQHVHTDSETGMKYCYGFLAGEACGDHDECLTNSYDSVAGSCEIGNDGLVCGCDDRHVLSGQKCVGVTFGGDCEIDESNDKVCESNTECLAEGATRTCQCGVSETWSSSHRRCQHDSVTTASEGEACNNSYESSSGKICSAELVCVNCPGETDDVCQRPVNGSTMTSLSVFGVLSLILFAVQHAL